MAILHLVRHAHARAGWGAEADPPLDEQGHAEAEALADRLGPRGPFPILTSPLRRARETAAALERRWHTVALVEPGLGEVPSPSEDLAERQEWLRTALASTWPELGPRFLSWRTMVTELLAGLTADTVVVTHFVAINAAVGRATDDDRVLCRAVPNAGMVVVDNAGRELNLVDGDDLVVSGEVGPVL